MNSLERMQITEWIRLTDSLGYQLETSTSLLYGKMTPKNVVLGVRWNNCTLCHGNLHRNLPENKEKSDNLFVVPFLQSFHPPKACILLYVFALTSLPLIPSLSLWSSHLLQLSSPPRHRSRAWHSPSFSQWSARAPEALSLSSAWSPSPSPRFTLKLWVSQSSVSSYLPLLSSARLIYLSLNRQSEGQIKTRDALRHTRTHRKRRVYRVNKPSWFLVAQTVRLQHSPPKFPR